jgi:lipooligosaccharide transport system ATP-binding protein
MKRRLTIARSLISEPDLVLLDEPTTGLDPQARHLLWERLYQLKERGVTLIITTHYMDEAEQLCDRLVIMDRGKIVAEGSPAQLIANHASRDVLELRFQTEGRAESISRLDGIGKKLEILPDRVLVSTDDAEGSLAEVYARDLHPIANLVRRSTLEDVFLALTGRTLVD